MITKIKQKPAVESITAKSASRFMSECKRLKLLGWELDVIDSYVREVTCTMKKGEELTIELGFRPLDSDENGSDEDLSTYLENLVVFVEDELTKDLFPEGVQPLNLKTHRPADLKI